MEKKKKKTKTLSCELKLNGKCLVLVSLWHHYGVLLYHTLGHYSINNNNNNSHYSCNLWQQIVYLLKISHCLRSRREGCPNMEKWCEENQKHVENEPGVSWMLVLQRYRQTRCDAHEIISFRIVLCVANSLLRMTTERFERRLKLNWWCYHFMI